MAYIKRIKNTLDLTGILRHSHKHKPTAWLLYSRKLAWRGEGKKQQTE